MSRKSNPVVTGRLCAICGRGASSFAHIEHRGMGGDPADNRTDGYPACGTDHSDATTCHGAQGQHLLTVERRSTGLWYCPSEAYAKRLRQRGVSARGGQWRPALYEHTDPDTIDARGDGTW